MLFTTKLLDNGVSLKYKFSEGCNLKHVIILDKDITTVLQEIGRVRATDQEQINIYILKSTKAQIKNILRACNKTIDIIDTFTDDREAFNNKYTLKNITEPYFYLKDDKIEANSLLRDVLTCRADFYKDVINTPFQTLTEYITTKYYNQTYEKIAKVEEVKEKKPRKKRKQKENKKPSKFEIQRAERIEKLKSTIISEDVKADVLEFLEGREKLYKGTNGSYTKLKKILKMSGRVTSEALTIIFEANNIPYQIVKDDVAQCYTIAKTDINDK